MDGVIAAAGAVQMGSEPTNRQMPSSPRILVVTKRVDLGGAEMHLLRVMPALRARGIDVSLYVLERGGRLEPEFVSAGIVIGGLQRAGSRALHLPKAALDLTWHIARTRPAAVHYFLPEPYLIGCAITPFARAHTRIMSRRSMADYQLKHRRLGGLERRFHRGTAAVLANSTAVAAELEAEVGPEDSRLKVGLIHNGVAFGDPPAAAERGAVRRALGLSDDAFVMVIVANLIGYKGHADLIDALSHAVLQLPRDWRLLVVGRDGGIGPSLVTRCGAAGLAANVVWLGERTDAASLMGASDLAVVASHEEGFSNSLIEAMGCGLPMVATAVGGNIDAVVDGVTGLLVPARDPHRMAEAILALAGAPDRRITMGAAARLRATTQFSLDACVTRYERLYRGLKSVGRVPVQCIIDGSDPVPVLSTRSGRA